MKTLKVIYPSHPDFKNMLKFLNTTGLGIACSTDDVTRIDYRGDLLTSMPAKRKKCKLEAWAYALNRNVFTLSISFN